MSNQHNSGLLRAIAIVLTLGGCTPSAPSEARLAEVFREHHATFVRLRDLMLIDRGHDQVRLDAYSWIDPCTLPSCKPAARRLGRPPGVSPAPCSSPGGCRRWVGSSPSAREIAGIGGIAVSRAQSYLSGLRSVGALLIQRGGRGDIEIVMYSQGIIPSGYSVGITWSSRGPPAVVDCRTGTTHLSVNWVELAPNWYIVHH